MYKKLLIGGLCSALFAIGIAPAFAQTSTTTTKNTAPVVSASTNILAKITCVGDAVNTREQALDTAKTTFTSADDTAYTARATALQEAYKNTTLASVKSSVKSAWATFTATEKTARTAWQTSRDSAWKTYRTTTTACKAPAGIGDGTKSTSETSGK